jgi:hypothetical protein
MIKKKVTRDGAGWIDVKKRVGCSDFVGGWKTDEEEGGRSFRKGGGDHGGFLEPTKMVASWVAGDGVHEMVGQAMDGWFRAWLPAAGTKKRMETVVGGPGKPVKMVEEGHVVSWNCRSKRKTRTHVAAGRE